MTALVKHIQGQGILIMDNILIFELFNSSDKMVIKRSNNRNFILNFSIYM